MAKTRNEIYAEVFRRLGADVKHEEFRQFCKKEHGIDVPKSSFYSAKRAFQEGGGVVPPSPDGEDPVIPIKEVPQLMGAAKMFLKLCGGDPEVAVGLIKSL